MIDIIVKPTEKVTQALIGEMKKKKTGLVVLLAKPFAAIAPLIKKNGINVKNFVFIDTVGSEKSDTVINVPISSLTALSIAISEALQSLPKSNRNIIMDSFNSFLIYHRPEVVKRFILFTFAQVRQSEAKMVILMGNEKTEGGILPLMQQSADNVISN